MKRKTIEEEWQGFSGMIFAKMKPPPGPVQIEETKRAFFAGAWAILTAMKAVGEPDVSESDGINYLDDLQHEGERFYQELMRQHSERN